MRIPKKEIAEYADQAENAVSRLMDIWWYDKIMPLVVKELVKRYLPKANPREGQSKGADHV